VVAVAITNMFAGAALDRCGERRTDADWIAARLADPDARALVIAAEGPLLEGDSPTLIPTAGTDLFEPVFLGLRDARPYFAVPGTPDLGAPGSPAGLRDVVTRVSMAEAGLLAYATAIVGWHHRHRFCANCGTKTGVAEAGHVRKCPNCGAQHHPRTDPVVIMLVHDGDRVLLGRQARWPPGRYSTLAGFVEPGESLEEAVAREVEEEAGVEVTDVIYRSSQPWPFPANLMLGFHARYAGGEARVGDAELEDVRWFSRDELAAIKRGETDLDIPPREAIARALIDEWLKD
jgi:NAD+ diphosphatase